MNRAICHGFAALVIACSWGCSIAAQTAPASTLKPFESEEALVAHVKMMAAEVQRRRDEEERKRAEAARKRAEAIPRDRAARGLPPLAEPKFSVAPAMQAAAASLRCSATKSWRDA